jgi:thymidylate synthase
MFHLKKATFDDLLRETYLRLLKDKGVEEVNSTKGRSLEVFGVGLELSNPRARLSRSQGRSRVFSALGELLWYLSGSNSLEPIAYYIRDYAAATDDKKTLNGAYGPRIFSATQDQPSSQWSRAIKRLKSERNQGTRNAVLQIATPSDFLNETKDRPCTCSIQFVVRRKTLHMMVHMRSNDVYLGLPHDIFAFTMLQEIAAREIGVGLGSYFHSVGSMHLYADPAALIEGSKKLDHRADAQAYIDEGLFSKRAMSPMPSGDPWPNIARVLEAEREIRNGNIDFRLDVATPRYWQDIVSLLRVHGVTRHMKDETIEVRRTRFQKYLDELHQQDFALYIRDKLESLGK